MTPSGGVGLVDDAVALSAFRMLPGGGERGYTATTFPADPWRGCERFLRMCKAVGWVTDDDDGYAVLDVLNENADIVQDFTIPDASAFKQIAKRLDLRVEHLDA